MLLPWCNGNKANSAAMGVATANKALGNPTRIAKIARLDALVGATVMSSDRKMIGMVEDVAEAPNNKIDVTIRLNAALRAPVPTVTVQMKMPDKNPKSMRLDFNAERFLKIVSG